MKNAFKVFRLQSEVDDNGQEYSYMVPESSDSPLSGDFCNESQVMEAVNDNKSKVSPGQIVILNVKTI